MNAQQLIEHLKKLPPTTVVLDVTTGIFDHQLRGKVDSHLAEYDDWMCSSIRIATPPPQGRNIIEKKSLKAGGTEP